jgi:HEPN domain-containing protein
MSGPANPSPGSPQDWLRHAKSDLALATHVENDVDVLPNQKAFHAQQAAEKAIKGVMVHEDIRFPLTHDLTELTKRWEMSGRTWPPALLAVNSLNPYAVESRYPGYVHQISTGEVRTAIALAGQVVA